ncbi:MAG: ATP-binding protein, partial [Mycobacteriales bacterium]
MSDAGSGRFVGRRTYLDELAGWLSEARAGRGRLVLLAGYAGVGKTRLAEQLAAAAGRAGVPAVWGRCPADAGAPPLWPLRRIVARLPGGPWPVPAGDEEGFGSTAEGSAAALFTRSVQLADTIVAAARPGGLLVVVEDLHWADSGTVSALGLVAAEVTGSRALVLGTARLPLEPGLTAALLERPGVEHRVLRGLERAEIVDYLNAVAGGDVDHRYADLVARQTAGNSLFVGVVARLLTERVSLRRYDAEAARTALAGRPEVAALAV